MLSAKQCIEMQRKAMQPQNTMLRAQSDQWKETIEAICAKHLQLQHTMSGRSKACATSMWQQHMGSVGEGRRSSEIEYRLRAQVKLWKETIEAICAEHLQLKTPNAEDMC